MKKVLILCLANPYSNPRPNRIIKYLTSKNYIVDVVSFPGQGELIIRNKMFLFNKNSVFQKIIKKVKKISYLFVSRFIKIKYLSENALNLSLGVNKYKKKLLSENYDFLFVEDLYLLPFAFKIKKQSSIFFDAREYYPEEFKSFFFNYFKKAEILRICEEYLHRCDNLITVSKGLSKLYFDKFGLDFKIIRSVPYYVNGSVQINEESVIKLVHHGNANRDRKIENLINIVNQLDSRYFLDLYLVGDNQYINELKQLISSSSKIRILEPVPYNMIVPMLSNYDIGFYYLEPNGLNTTFNLPNKIFEFIQARLAVFIGPSPDMSDIVTEFNCGFIADSFEIEDSISLLSGLTYEKIQLAKENSNLAAKILCYENEIKKLDNIIK
jgi:hypothetical protein